jgi:hypothetical protein
VKGTPSSQLRSSNSWGCRQHHTHNHTTSGGFTRDKISVSANSVLSYGIQPFKDEVVCDVSPLDVCDVVLGQPYMWKHHVVYESRPRSVIITLGGHLYRIPEVVPTIVPPKQCHKVISHTAKFILFTVCSKDAQKATTTTTASTPSIQQKQLQKRKNILFLHLQWCLHNAPSSPETTGWWNRFNPTSNRFVTTFHRPSNTTSPTRHTTHQDSDSENAFPLFPGNSTQWRPLLPKGED